MLCLSMQSTQAACPMGLFMYPIIGHVTSFNLVIESALQDAWLIHSGWWNIADSGKGILACLGATEMCYSFFYKD